MDSLYYGDHQCHCGQHHFRNASSIRFDADVLSMFMKKVYDGFDTKTQIEPSAWREVLKIINGGTVEGLAAAPVPPTHDELFYRELRHSNEIFAAFKVHTMGNEMAAKLYDANGNLKPFEQWARDVSSIASHQVGSWLQTEYDTAVIRAHAAANWKEFERNRDIMPNLKWMPTTSPEPESSHRQYWQMGLTLPIDDPFWNEHHPGDRWNCKCSLEATDEPVNRPDDMEPTKPQRGLENNPGKDGHTFNDTHPYFPESCSKCPIRRASGFKSLISKVFSNQQKHCFHCAAAENMMKKAAEQMKMEADSTPPAVETYISSCNGNVLTSPYHGNEEMKENLRLAEFVNWKLGQKIYLLPRLDPQNPKEMVLRPTLIPVGVFTNKNPDFLIGGLFFDGKSMLNIKNTGKQEKFHNDILNRIKSARQQADNMILEIPKFVKRKTISSTIQGYLEQSSKRRVIMVKHGKKLYVYKNTGHEALS